MRKWIIFVVVVAVVALFFMVKPFHQPVKKKPALPAVLPVRVVTQQVCPQTIPMLVAASGSIMTHNQTILRPKQAGYITRIYFKEGQRVKANQILVSLDSRIQAADLQQKEIALKQARQTYRRNKAAVESGGISQQALDQTQTDYQQAKNAVEQAKITLDDMQIRAPFAGVVGQNNLSIGQYVTSQANLVQLLGAKQLRVSYQLPSRYAGQAKLGQLVTVMLAGNRYDAKVSFVASQVVSDTQTFSVTALLDKADQSIKPGQWVQLTQQLGSQSGAILLPGLSVQTEIGSYYVFVVSNKKAQQVAVTLGDRKNGQVVITSGLKVGQWVVTAGADQLHQGSVVVATQKNSARCAP